MEKTDQLIPFCTTLLGTSSLLKEKSIKLLTNSVVIKEKHKMDEILTPDDEEDAVDLAGKMFACCSDFAAERDCELDSYKSIFLHSSALLLSEIILLDKSNISRGGKPCQVYTYFERVSRKNGEKRT